MNRNGRLQSAAAWLPTYQEKNIVRGYRNHYGVDLECAIAELRLLGVSLDEKRIERARAGEQERLRQLQLRRVRRDLEVQGLKTGDDSDDIFAFIAGYTSGGAPYGILRDAPPPSFGDDSPEDV